MVKLSARNPEEEVSGIILLLLFQFYLEGEESQEILQGDYSHQPRTIDDQEPGKTVSVHNGQGLDRIGLR